jgi:hypothetical protein
MLSLKNPIANLSQITQSPSKSDGIDEILEDDLRCLGCELIQNGGILLKL